MNGETILRRAAHRNKKFGGVLMKSVFRHISKKALSSVLALIIVITSISATVGVFANTEPSITPYEVTYGSPAIPMFANKMIDLKNVKVQFAKDGEFIPGGDIVWSADDAASVEMLSEGRFYAFGKGIYKLKATYTPDGEPSVSKTVYVAVNEQDDYDFTLFNKNLSGATSAQAEEWVYAKASSAWNHTTLTKTAHATGNDWDFERPDVASANRFFYHKYNAIYTLMVDVPILADFEDYTVEAVVGGGSSDSDEAWGGLVVKANADLTANTIFNTDTTALYLIQRRYGALAVGTFGANEYGTEKWGMEYASLHSFEGAEWKKTLKGNADTDRADYMVIRDNRNDKSVKRTMSVKLSGTDILYKLDGKEILDTTKKVYKISDQNSSAATSDQINYDTTVAPVVKTSAGSCIGITFCQTDMSLYAMSAKLNVDSTTVMPHTTDIDLYTVSDASPAIPMFAGTSINLANTVVEFEDGTFSLGSNLTWALNESSGNLKSTQPQRPSAHTAQVFTS